MFISVRIHKLDFFCSEMCSSHALLHSKTIKLQRNQLKLKLLNSWSFLCFNFIFFGKNYSIAVKLLWSTEYTNMCSLFISCLKLSLCGLIWDYSFIDFWFPTILHSGFFFNFFTELQRGTIEVWVRFQMVLETPPPVLQFFCRYQNFL